MEIVANDPDVMDDKKILSEMKENKESPCQSSLQSPNYKLPNEMKPLGLDVVIAATQITTM